mgnify:CR=1 FL=1
MKLAISQPTFLPWQGYIALVNYADELVILDDVQFEKRSWQQRNNIKQNDEKLLLIAGQNGLGIRTRFSAFLPNGGKLDDGSIEEATPRKRGGQGVTAMNTDCIVGALSVDPDSEILMITSNGQAVRCPVDNIRETNRGSKGVKLVNLNDKDSLLQCLR